MWKEFKTPFPVSSMEPSTERSRLAAVKIEQSTRKTQSEAFGKFAAGASNWLGSKWAFVGAIVVIAVWAVTGPVFHYSDTWQLVINTGTTIITFLMVSIIQNTQNRDARAINLKLDELIHSIDAAGNQMLDIERLSDKELDVLQAKYEKLRAASIEDATESGN